jgi:hypothetical protein
LFATEHHRSVPTGSVNIRSRGRRRNSGRKVVRKTGIGGGRTTHGLPCSLAFPVVVFLLCTVARADARMLAERGMEERMKATGLPTPQIDERREESTMWGHCLYLSHTHTALFLLRASGRVRVRNDRSRVMHASPSVVRPLMCVLHTVATLQRRKTKDQPSPFLLSSLPFVRGSGANTACLDAGVCVCGSATPTMWF